MPRARQSRPKQPIVLRADVESLRAFGIADDEADIEWWGTRGNIARDGGFQVVFRKDTAYVTYASGELLLPERFYFLWGPSFRADGLRLTLDMAVERNELVCKSLLAQSSAVTTGLLRDLKLKDLIERFAGPRAAFRLVERPDGSVVRRPAILTEDGATTWMQAYAQAADVPRRGKRVSDERLEQVAEIYRSAQALGQPPKKSVSEALFTSISNAGRWVAEARRRGFLEPVPGSQAGQKGDTDG